VLYRAAWLFEVGQRVQVPESGSEDAGVKLVREMVLSRVGDAEQRKAARELLMRRAESADVEPWQEAWCRAAVGRSLMSESDGQQRREGVLQALHVPARLARHAPELAALALNELGDSGGAGALKDELARLSPGHALLDWPALRTIRAQGAAGPKAVTP
jgi:hypothetical protein